MYGDTKISIILATCCLLGFLPNSIQGQPVFQDSTTASRAPQFDHLRIEQVNDWEGVLVSSISMTEDSSGYMWFGTADGLVRFDGYDFEYFAYDPTDSTSLPQNWVDALYVDRAGTLWVGLHQGGGLARYNPATESFTRYSFRDDSYQAAVDTVTVILEDHLSDFWVGTHGGLFLFDRELETFTRYSHDPDDSTSLSNDQVRALYEDADGTLWVGTGSAWGTESRPGAGGLNRFERDTGAFTRFLHDPEDITTLIDNKVRSIYEDSHGNFWVGTLGSVLHRLDRSTGTFERYALDPERSGLLRLISEKSLNEHCRVGSCGRTINFIEEDEEGLLWVGAYGLGLFLVDPINNMVYPFPGDSGTPDNFPTAGSYSYYESRDGIRWLIPLRQGVYRLTTAFRRFSHIRSAADNPNSLSDDRITYMHEDGQGILWIGTIEGGVNRLDPETGVIIQYRHDPTDEHSLSNDGVTSLQEDSTERLWIGTFGGGLNRFEPDTGAFTRYRHDSGDSGSLSDDRVTCLFEDGQGTLWIGTYSGGLNRFDSESGEFAHHKFGTDNPNGLSSTPIAWIYEAPKEPGVLWIGTVGNGLNRLDIATDSFTVYTGISNRRYRPALFNTLETLDREDRSIASLLKMGNDEDRSFPFEVSEETPVLIASLGEYLPAGNLADYGWIESETGETVWSMNLELTRSAGGYFPNRTQVEEFRLLPGSYLLRFRSDQGYSHVDNWFDTLPPDYPDRWGIQVYSLLGHAGILTDDDKTEAPLPGTISSNYVTSVHEDEAGTLWIVTDRGLDMFDRESGLFTSYLSGRNVYALYEDQQGRIWLGTGDGLYLFDRTQTQQPIEIESNDTLSVVRLVGLQGRYISGMLADEDGMLWISHTNGLTRYDPDMRVFTHQFGTADGLDVINVTDYLKSQRGELFFGGGGGVVHFFPSQVINKVSPTIVLTDLHIFNELIEPGSEAPIKQSMRTADSITLLHTQDDFTIDYVGLHFDDPTRNQYMYKLEGYDQDWVQARDRRSARYSRLPPGSYTFSVKAASSEGIWGKEATIDITVLPPWWRTWWAYLLYGLLFAVGVFAVDRFQRKRLIAKERLRAEREKAKAIESTNNELQRALKHLTETQDQLIHTEKMASLGQLTAGIAHEIKNPLNFVNNFAVVCSDQADDIQRLLEKYKDRMEPDDAHELKAVLDDLRINTQKINEHGQRADGIIRSMLEHSRVAKGERRSIELNKLLDEYVNLAYHGVKAREEEFTVDLSRSYDDAIEEIEIVPQEIGRVFINLLDNAFYAINEKRLSMNGEYTPEVSVSTKKTDRKVVIYVSDNGTGIPEEIREKVFEPFFTTKPAGSGTGLGLSLSYDIVVKGHGGNLRVYSEEGEGATFIVTLPSGNSMTG